MKENLRPWFYVACLVIWICAAVVPGIISRNAEQKKIDDAFYAAVNAPTLEEIFESTRQLQLALKNIRTWNDYGSALAEVYRLETYIDKHRYNKLALKNPDVNTLMRADVRLNSIRTSTLRFAMEELRERERTGDTTIGNIPEGGFIGNSSQQRPLAPFWIHFWTALWSSWIFAFLVLLVRLDAEGFNVGLELVTPWLYLATLAWPIGLFKYPNGDPAKQLVRGLRFAAFALTAGLSMSPAVASAQTKAGKDSKKKSSPYTFTIDTRNVRMVGPDPKPAEVVIKSTFTTPRGWYLQTTQTNSDGLWSNQTVAGHTAFKKSGVRLDAVAGLTKNSAGATIVPVGVVGSVNRSRWQLFLPYIGYERRLDKPANHFVVVNQVLVKMGTWRAGTETFFKKATGAPSQWYAGGVLVRTFGKKSFGEVVTYRNQIGEWRVRGRIGFAYSW